MAKEYIERDAVMSEIQEIFHKTVPNGEEQVGILKCHQVIRKHPAAYVVPVVHGEWLPVFDDDQYEGEYYCSVCNAEEFFPENAPFAPYCWHCGAKMDGGTGMNDNRMNVQSQLQDIKSTIVGYRYRHFKGGIYNVTNIAVHSETEEPMVIYESFDNPNLVWCRPLSMFLSEVDKEKYPDAKQVMRFERIGKVE